MYFEKIKLFSQYTGYYEQEVHVILKEKVLLPIMNLSSTKDLVTNALWEQYLEECKIFIFNELDIIF